MCRWKKRIRTIQYLCVVIVVAFSKFHPALQSIFSGTRQVLTQRLSQLENLHRRSLLPHLPDNHDRTRGHAQGSTRYESISSIHRCDIKRSKEPGE